MLAYTDKEAPYPFLELISARSFDWKKHQAEKRVALKAQKEADQDIQDGNRWIRKERSKWGIDGCNWEMRLIEVMVSVIFLFTACPFFYRRGAVIVCLCLMKIL